MKKVYVLIIFFLLTFNILAYTFSVSASDTIYTSDLETETPGAQINLAWLDSDDDSEGTSSCMISEYGTANSGTKTFRLNDTGTVLLSNLTYTYDSDKYMNGWQAYINFSTFDTGDTLIFRFYNNTGIDYDVSKPLVYLRFIYSGGNIIYQYRSELTGDFVDVATIPLSSAYHKISYNYSSYNNIIYHLNSSDEFGYPLRSTLDYDIRYLRISSSGTTLSAMMDDMTIEVGEQKLSANLTNPFPADGETNVALTEQKTNITLTLPKGGTDYNLNWYWLDASSWEHYGTNTSAVNGSYSQLNSNFSDYSTTYQWAVNVSNATSFNNQTFSFTTRTALANPTSIDGTVYGGTNLNITWTQEEKASATVVMYKADSYPSSPTDGTELYNGTNEYYNHTSYLETYYYTLYSYNSTDNIFSSGENLAWGDLNVSVFNETGGAAITDWDIFITNPATGLTYEAANKNNYLLVDADDFPTGDETTIVISKTGYRDGVFTMDIDDRTRYSLDAYLTNENNSGLYQITVVGLQGEFTSPPVEDVEVTFEKFITGGDYEKIGQYFTDANGQFNIYLIPGDYYKVTLSKTDYDTKIEYYLPDEDDKTQEFRITPSTTTADIYDDFTKNITFTATMDDPGYLLDSNITVSYNDANSSTVNFQIYLYDISNTTEVYVGMTSATGLNTYSYDFTGINNTKIYRADLYFNNTANFYVTPPVPVVIYPQHTYTPGKTKFDLDDRIDNIIGEFTYNSDGDNLSWATILSVVLCVILLATFGVYNVGLGIIGGGFGLLLTQAIYVMKFTNDFSPTLAAIGVFAVAIGVFYLMTVDKPGGGL